MLEQKQNFVYPSSLIHYLIKFFLNNSMPFKRLAYFEEQGLISHQIVIYVLKKISTNFLKF